MITKEYQKWKCDGCNFQCRVKIKCDIDMESHICIIRIDNIKVNWEKDDA